LFQASKIRSKANWLKDAIDVGDPEQLSRHINEMRASFIPFKVEKRREREGGRGREGERKKGKRDSNL
jgi:hypothetical protein